jgi:hypothetical protein
MTLTRYEESTVDTPDGPVTVTDETHVHTRAELAAAAKRPELTAHEAARLSGLTLRDVARACRHRTRTPDRINPDEVVTFAEALRLSYVAARKRTRPARRAFGARGDGRRAALLAQTAARQWDRDCRAIRDAIILGTRDVPGLSYATGLRRSRIRQVVRVERIRAVQS